MTDTRSFVYGFGGQFITVATNGIKALELVDFLCCDLQQGDGEKSAGELIIGSSGRDSSMYLRTPDGSVLYEGSCSYQLAYCLINEFIRLTLIENSFGFGIHGGAVACGGNAILFPGTSGAGKSTLVAQLVAKGCNYLTDELVLLDAVSCRIYPFVRPLSFKMGSVSVIKRIFTLADGEIIVGDSGFMVPHRILNPNFNNTSPVAGGIIFPRYRSGSGVELERISSALGCFKLLECFVNARNIKDHGMDKLARVTRKVPCYNLTYGNFEDLFQAVKTQLPELFTL